MAKQLKPKEWTEKQLARLPQPGYWLYEFKRVHPRGTYHEFTAYCVKNGYIRYIRTDNPNPTWWTLLWSCMHTQKQIASPRPEETFHFFNTLEEMQQAFPHLHPNFFVKPENDF
jgi:hypothetical protein